MNASGFLADILGMLSKSEFVPDSKTDLFGLFKSNYCRVVMAICVKYSIV